MKRGFASIAAIIAVALYASAAFAAGNGEAIFKAKCASCHPDGGNVMKPNETIKGLKDTKKIIAQVRKGGGGMPAFDAKSISDTDAKLLAGYIVKTFKK